ncbi:hypothetical protein Tco_1006807 [Tanacetum coccineum]|uniref:Uncharacterized protein n=1 Tax=Tanacetum coccineum TaxID=301880 RepID=A0ABQ5FJX5_9ASTR
METAGASTSSDNLFDFFGSTAVNNTNLLSSTSKQPLIETNDIPNPNSPIKRYAMIGARVQKIIIQQPQNPIYTCIYLRRLKLKANLALEEVAGTNECIVIGDVWELSNVQKLLSIPFLLSSFFLHEFN